MTHLKELIAENTRLKKLLGVSERRALVPGRVNVRETTGFRVY